MHHTKGSSRHAVCFSFCALPLQSIDVKLLLISVIRVPKDMYIETPLINLSTIHSHRATQLPPPARDTQAPSRVGCGFTRMMSRTMELSRAAGRRTLMQRAVDRSFRTSTQAQQAGRNPHSPRRPRDGQSIHMQRGRSTTTTLRQA